MKTYNIASIAGDGIGTEVVPVAQKVLKKMIKDKIEKQWSESFVENLNFVMVSRNTIKRSCTKASI